MNILQLYSHILIVIFIIYMLLFIHALSKEDNPLAKLFALICISSALYILGTIFQINGKTLDGIMFGQKIKYFGISISGGLWLLLTYRIYFKRAMGFKATLINFIILILTIILVSTNEYHHLYYKEISTFTYEGFLLSRRIPGRLYNLNTVYSYIVMFFGLYTSFMLWIKSGAKKSKPLFLYIFL